MVSNIISCESTDIYIHHPLTVKDHFLWLGPTYHHYSGTREDRSDCSSKQTRWRVVCAMFGPKHVYGRRHDATPDEGSQGAKKCRAGPVANLYDSTFSFARRWDYSLQCVVNNEREFLPSYLGVHVLGPPCRRQFCVVDSHARRHTGCPLYMQTGSSQLCDSNHSSKRKPTTWLQQTMGLPHLSITQAVVLVHMVSSAGCGVDNPNTRRSFTSKTEAMHLINQRSAGVTRSLRCARRQYTYMMGRGKA